MARANLLGLVGLYRALPRECKLAGAFCAAVSALATYYVDGQNRLLIPIAFSELSHMKQQAELGLRADLQPLDEFYAGNNDNVMMIYEANNLALTRRDYSDYDFAFELEKKIEPTFGFHTQIPEFTQVIPDYAEEALKSIERYRMALHDIAPVVVALDNTWDESHTDHYDYDSTSEEWEYDYTTHTYRYDAGQGALSVRLVEAFVEKYPDLEKNYVMQWTNATHAENEMAMRDSRQNKADAYTVYTQDQYLIWANAWSDGSNYTYLSPLVAQGRNDLALIAPKLRSASRTAHYTSYDTGFKLDSGPIEFQIFEETFSHAVKIQDSLEKIIGGIEYAAEQTPRLNNLIVNFVNATLHNGEGDPASLRREIMRTARDLYLRNYEGGLDVRAHDYALVAKAAGIGLGAGVVGGFGYLGFRRKFS